MLTGMCEINVNERDGILKTSVKSDMTAMNGWTMVSARTKFIKNTYKNSKLPARKMRKHEMRDVFSLKNFLSKIKVIKKFIVPINGVNNFNIVKDWNPVILPKSESG